MSKEMSNERALKLDLARRHARLGAGALAHDQLGGGRAGQAG